jgi:hypothetical protein
MSRYAASVRAALMPHGHGARGGYWVQHDGVKSRKIVIRKTMIFPKTIDTTQFSRVAGLTGDCTAWVTTRPFRALPDHVGCGTDRGRPRADARRGVARAPRGALPGGTAGMRPLRLGGLAATARGWSHIPTIARTSSTCERWQALRDQRSMVPAEGDEGPSSSCPLLKDRYRSKSAGYGSTAAALCISSVLPREEKARSCDTGHADLHRRHPCWRVVH